MKEKMKGMQGVERKYGVLGKVLPTATLLAALLGSHQEGLAKNVSGTDEGVVVTEVTSPKMEEKKSDTIDWGKTIQLTGVKDKDEGVSEWDDGKKKLGATGGDGDDGDKDKGTLPEDGSGQTKEKSKSGASFSRQTGVGYSVTGGKALWVNRFVGSGTLFKGKLGEVHITGIADLDDPLHTKGSGKLILGKSLYKGLSFDGDYTFTGAGNNVFRVGMGYSGKLGDGTYGVRIFPLNTNGSPISAKVSFSTKVGKSGSLSSFVFVDFDTKCYYSETEYIHQLAKGVAAFLQARLMGTMDGKFTGVDSQILMGGLKVNL